METAQEIFNQLRETYNPTKPALQLTKSVYNFLNLVHKNPNHVDEESVNILCELAVGLIKTNNIEQGQLSNKNKKALSFSNVTKYVQSNRVKQTLQIGGRRKGG